MSVTDVSSLDFPHRMRALWDFAKQFQDEYPGRGVWLASSPGVFSRDRN